MDYTGPLDRTRDIYNSPLVTIVLTTYKRPDKLRQSLQSACELTYTNLEIIVVDDNGQNSSYSSKTASVINQFKNVRDITYIQHPSNLGACSARNSGLQAAHGEYISFLDDDDYIYPNKITEQIRPMLCDFSIAFSICDVIQVRDEKNIISTISYSQPNQEFVDYLLSKRSGICTSVMLFRTSYLQSINGFDPALASYQDYDLLLRLSSLYKYSYERKPLVKYNLCSDGISANIRAKYDGKLSIIKKHHDLLSLPKYRRVYCYHYLDVGDYALQRGLRLLALGHYITAVRISPLSIKAYGKILSLILFLESVYFKLSSLLYTRWPVRYLDSL